jgi:3-isopropylmalate dehydrogenase
VSTFRVAVIGGDGIGPEVTAAAQRVVDAVGEGSRFSVEWQPVAAGGAAIDAYGTALRDEDLDACRAADAVLLGAVGGPKWDDPTAAVRPEQALFRLRGGLGLFANLRPVHAEPTLIGASPLRPELVAGVDMLIVRELTGGLYFGDRTEAAATGAGAGADGDERRAVDSLPYSESEIRRVVRLAFELATHRRRHLTSVDKANVLATSRLWRTVADELAADFYDVTLEHRLVDACAMQLVTSPQSFDVIVTENLFGDILSDEASVLAGSLGMLPSASLGERRTEHGIFGLYEPVHGSAPDIAGRGVANPLGAILSAAMMLRWSLGRPEAATAIEAGVRGALAAGTKTPDLGGESGTLAVTTAVIDHVTRGSAAATGAPA